MYRFIIGLIFLIPAAIPSMATDVLQVIENVRVPLAGFTKLIYAVCYILGTLFLVGGLTQYKQHRQNPQQVRISTPVFLVILGLGLFVFPWLLGLSQASSYLNAL